MRTLIIGLIALALVAAGGTAFLVKRTLDDRTADQTAVVAQPANPETVVLVVSKTLPAGTEVTAGNLSWQGWPSEAVHESFTSSAEEDEKLEQKFVGAVIRHGIAAGTPITKDMVFRRETSGFLAGTIQPGMRAVAVSVTAESGAAGFIHPGDRVDVVLVHDIRKDYNKADRSSPVIAGNIIRNTAETILRNIRVLAAGQKFNDLDKEAKVVKTVTLEVSPAQGEKLAVAKAMGRISLVLRSLAQDSDRDPTESFTTDLQVSPTLVSVFTQEERPELAGRVFPVAGQTAPPRPAVTPPAKLVELKKQVVPEKQAAKVAKQVVKVTKSGAKVAKSGVKSETQGAKPRAAATNNAPEVKPVVADQPVSDNLRRMAQVLKPGTRAVAVSVTAESAAAGFIQPGDHVDVILTHDVKQGLPQAGAKISPADEQVIRFTAETILTKIPVLAIDQKVGDTKEQAVLVRTVTLQVTPGQAETLAVASAMGKISLSLRSVAAGEKPEKSRLFTSDVEVSATLANALAQASMSTEGEGEAQRKVAAPVSTPVANPPPRSSVKVYKAGTPSVVVIPGR